MSTEAKAVLHVTVFSFTKQWVLLLNLERTMWQQIVGPDHVRKKSTALSCVHT